MEKVNECESMFGQIEEARLEGIKAGYLIAKMDVLGLLKTLPDINMSEESIDDFLNHLSITLIRIKNLEYKNK